MGRLAAMRARSIVALAAFVVACSSTKSATPPADAGAEAAACDMHAGGVQFPTAACDTCMQAKCCAQAVACYGTGAADCAALDKCSSACPPSGTTVGGGGDGGGGGGGGGGGPSCLDTCNAAHPDSVAARKAYNDCIRDPCIVECAK